MQTYQMEGFGTNWEDQKTERWWCWYMDLSVICMYGITISSF